MFDSLAARAALVGLALLRGIAEATDEAEGRLRRLRIATGTEEDREGLAELLARGVGETEAIGAIAALQGQGAGLGVDRGDQAVLRTLADVESVGGSGRLGLQALRQFGVRGSENVAAALEIGVVGALAANIDPDRFLRALRDYGPVFAAAGLTLFESMALIYDLVQTGVDPSRVSPGLNLFIRAISREGGDPRESLIGTFEAIEAAGTEQEAVQIGEGAFGAEGALRLTRAIRSGQVGLGEELSLAHLASLPGLSQVAAATPGDRFDLINDALVTQGGIAGTVVGGIGGAIGSVPLVGDLYGAAGSAFLRGGLGGGGDDPFGLQGPLFQTPGVVAALESLETSIDRNTAETARQSELTEIQRQEEARAAAVVAERERQEVGRLADVIAGLRPFFQPTASGAAYFEWRANRSTAEGGG